MQSCLFLESADRSAARELLDRLRVLPGLATLSNLRLLECLMIDAAYPPQTLATLLMGLGGQITLSLELTDDARCVPLEPQPDENTAMLLRAAGIDAIVTRQPIVVLRGLDDGQYHQVRDTLATRMAVQEIPLRRLPDDAFIGFTHIPPNQLYAQAKALGLALPENCWAIIAEHYRTEGRDPWPEELLILDEAFRQALTEPSVCAPVEFVTDDPRLHAAYADWMEKRRALAPEANAPATLGELTTVATRYLCGHSSKATPAARVADSPLTLAASGGSLCGGFADLSGETSLYLSATAFPAAPLQEGDRLLLVQPGTAKEANNGRLARALTQFFASPFIAGQIRQSLPVKPGRLISALGRMLGDTGFGLRLTSPDGISLTAHLTPTLPGALLACAAGAGKIIPDALRAQGLRFVLIAAVQKSPMIEFDRAPERLRFPAAMLAPRPALCAEISASGKPAPALVGEPLPALLSSLASPAARRLMAFDPTAATSLSLFPAETIVCGDTRLCAVTIQPGDDPFGEIRDAALALAARMAAAGAPLSDITLSLFAELPTGDHRTQGRAIAALLGLHTVQVELGLAATPPALRNGDTLRLTLAAMAPVTIQPLPLSEGTSLWLLTPCANQPHLDGERALLTLAARAHTTSAQIASGFLAPAAAAARAALAAGITLTLTAPVDVLTTPIPAGLLLAAPALPVLPEGIAAVELGITQPWREQAVVYGEAAISVEQLVSVLRGDLPAPLLPAGTASSPPRISARRYPHPRVLIPYADSLPTALIETIASLGGEPVPCVINLSSAAAARQSLSAYAGLLDSTQILLLSGSRALVSALLSQRRTCDALANLRARDGLVCAWGEAFAALLWLGFFSTDGTPIPTEPLVGLRIPCSVITSTASPWTNRLPLGYRETVLLAADPLCPALSPSAKLALAESGSVIACAAGTPDGSPAITALSSTDRALLGLAYPPTPAMLGRGIAYFA